MNIAQKHLSRFSKSKALAIGFVLFSILMAGSIIRELTLKLAVFPVQRGLAFPFIQFICLSAILYVSYRNVWVKTSIVAMVAFLLATINSVVMWGYYKFAPFYINTVVAQPTYIEYSFDGAVSTYKLLIYISFIIAFIVWLRFVLIIRHNLLEQ